jgi:hypothetical protein
MKSCVKLNWCSCKVVGTSVFPSCRIEAYASLRLRVELYQSLSRPAEQRSHLRRSCLNCKLPKYAYWRSTHPPKKKKDPHYLPKYLPVLQRCAEDVGVMIRKRSGGTAVQSENPHGTWSSHRRKVTEQQGQVRVTSY